MRRLVLSLVFGVWSWSALGQVGATNTPISLLSAVSQLASNALLIVVINPGTTNAATRKIAITDLVNTLRTNADLLCFTLANGYQNTNTGTHAVVAGGSNNLAQTLGAVISGGAWNKTLGGGSDYDKRFETIVGGESNIISGSSAHSISGNFLNVTTNARYSVNFAWRSLILGDPTIGCSNSANLSGQDQTNQCANSVIVGGWQNSILLTNNNPVDISNSDVIGGGYRNTMIASYGSVIAGGSDNAMIGPGNNNQHGYHVVAGGTQNKILNTAYYNAIGGGNGNRIGNSSANFFQSSIIPGGQDNIIEGTDSVILGSFNAIFGAEGYAIGVHMTNNGAQIDLGFNNESKVAIKQNAGISNNLAFANAPSVHEDLGDVARSGTTATWTSYNTHGFLSGDVVTIVGFAEPNFNGSKTITVVNATTFTYPVSNTGAASDTFGYARYPFENLLADNSTVSTVGRSYIRLRSDTATAANRTFVLSKGSFQGQELVLEWVGTNAGELVDDSAQSDGGNTRLSATWTPTQYDTLTLIFNGLDWLERSRSAN